VIFWLLLGMDEKIIFYIVLGIVYFIFNALKKKKPDNEPGSDHPPTRPQTNKPQPVTFEELLREITEGKETEKIPESPVTQTKPEFRQVLPKPKPAYIDYDDDLEDEERSLEKTNFDDERSNKAYEDAKKMAFNRPSLEETMSLDQVNTTFGRFKEFDKKQDSPVLAEYVKDLRDPKGFKRALILNELLNRKHF
jgi:hypothetical protein